MFVSDEVIVNSSFRVAHASLAKLAQSGCLNTASEGAYDDGLGGLTSVGPLGDLLDISKLVGVRFRELVVRDDIAVLTMRWEASAPGGDLFPALDADITSTPAGEQFTRLTLAGVCRLPLAGAGAGLDKTIMHRAATATMRSLLGRLADAIAHPERPAEVERENHSLARVAVDSWARGRRSD
jgi:hypothetical protein